MQNGDGPETCWRCGMRWNEFQQPHPKDPTRCGPCYSADNDTEFQKIAKQWIADGRPLV